jgi:crotonobetainyl-CoA:carnitine CoA-transferase CaiB-like acyl-CoA transferase
MSPLSHLKVIEIASGLGAYTGRMFAELGAEVIKVEPASGDPARAIGPFPEGGATGLPWLAWNAGKRSIATDDPAVLRKLLATADILIVGEDAAPPPFAELAAANPRLIEVVVAPFAEHGVHYGRPASDLTLMALSGLMAIVGDPDRPPLKLPGEQAWALAAIHGVTAGLLAISARRASGKGQRVVVSAYQAAVLANYREPVVWAFDKRLGRRTGNQLMRGKSAVRQVWQASDGYVTWALVDNPGMVKGMIGLMQETGPGAELAAELAAVDWDNILVANADQADVERWEALLEAYFLTQSKGDLFDASNKRGLGLSRIDDVDDALSSANAEARHFWRRIDDQARGIAYSLPGMLFASSLDQTPRINAAPALGEANGDYL